MHRLDNAATALHALNAVRTAQGRQPYALDEVGDEEIGDLIADLLHLANRAELDPEEVHAKGWSYFDGDAEEEELAQFTPGVIGYHGTPAVLAPGDQLTPGPHLHHVYATRYPESALMWGRTKARGDRTAPVNVYRVRFADDAEESSGHLYGVTATVLDTVEDPAAAPVLVPATV